MRKKMTDAEFQALVKKIGYVEAIVVAAKRDGYPVDEAALRAQAEAGIAALKARGFTVS